MTADDAGESLKELRNVVNCSLPCYAFSPEFLVGERQEEIG